MKKLRPTKSMFASGPPQKVRIDGLGKKSLSKEAIQVETYGLLKVLAALVETNRGPLSVSNETLQKVGQQGRVLQILPGQFGVIIKFKEENDGTRTENRTEETPVDTAGGEKFYNSESAREAREYLRRSRDTDVGSVDSGVCEVESSVGNSDSESISIG